MEEARAQDKLNLLAFADRGTWLFLLETKTPGEVDYRLFYTKLKKPRMKRKQGKEELNSKCFIAK